MVPGNLRALELPGSLANRPAHAEPNRSRAEGDAAQLRPRRCEHTWEELVEHRRMYPRDLGEFLVAVPVVRAVDRDDPEVSRFDGDAIRLADAPLPCR
jgi:hypothetical protein